VNTLGIDLASRKVGWAVYLGYRLAAAGTWDIEASIGPGEGTGARWAALLNRLQHVADLYEIGPSGWVVAYEEVTFSSSGGYRAAQCWGAAEGVLELWLHQRGIKPGQVQRVHVADVKMLATRKGGGVGTDKKAILAAARARADWKHIEFRDDNAADAAFVALAALMGLPAARDKARRVKKDGIPKRKRTPTARGGGKRGQLKLGEG
jgi:hypothetical protein